MPYSKSLVDESPLLHEAFFLAESEEDWRPHLAALAESPFERAFEQDSDREWLAEAETGVIRGDNRLRIMPTTGVPWRWICRVEVKLKNETQAGGGTGVLVSNRHVLTAAHVVYEAARNMQQFDIQVIPAFDDGKEPFGSYSVTAKPKLPANYDPDAADHVDWDYALLKLNTAVGAKTCFWGSPTCGVNSVFARPDPATLNGKAVFTAGYPRSAGFKKLMCAAGILHSAQRLRRTMGLTADTTKGQSGSPIWVVENQRCCLVGIAAGAGESSNTAVRVTRELVRQLREWITADGETPAMIESEAELDSPALELQTEDDEPSFEMLVPKVSQADLRTRIDEYFELANATYLLQDDSEVSARPQFRYTKAGGAEEAKTKASGILGKRFEKDHPRAIHNAAYGRAKPSEIQAITQGLIDKGELEAVRKEKPKLANEQLVRALQRKFKMGIDCAGYVQLAFIYAYMGTDNDSPRLRRKLGLHEMRGSEKLADLSSRHFKTVKVVDAQTGDLFVLKPRLDSEDHAWHTVIVFDHTIADPIHSFVVDASWGTDLYGEEFGGVARRTLKHDTSTGEWWDVSPVDGAEAHRNTTGPYDGHRIHGMFRAKEKK